MIPISDLRKHLRIPPTNTTETPYISDLERAAVAAIELYTAHYYGPVEQVGPEILDGPGEAVVWLNETPVVDDDHELLLEEWNGSEWTAVDVADFEVDGPALFHLTGIFGFQKRGLRLTYYRGYEPGEEPENVRHAVRQQVAEWYQNREASEAKTLSDSVKAMLSRRILV